MVAWTPVPLRRSEVPAFVRDSDAATSPTTRSAPPEWRESDEGARALRTPPQAPGHHPHVATGGTSAEASHVLLVDDDVLVQRVFAAALEADQHEVTSVDSGEAALAALDGHSFDAVLLDLTLPGLSGFETLRQVRARSDVPVIIVTGTSTVAERIAGFDLGCDDYLVKPIDVDELSRRVRAVMRRRGVPATPEERLLGPNDLVMRLRQHTVWVGGEEVKLTPKEFAILRLLLEHRDEVISSDDLSVQIWGYETFGSRNFVEAHVSRLRSKLAKAGAPDVVTTMRGVGYVVR